MEKKKISRRASCIEQGEAYPVEAPDPMFINLQVRLLYSYSEKGQSEYCIEYIKCFERF